ncbi:MAG: GNAT family N-acetyltransferase [Lachnospiraceae bacterium]|nr:GNAT family N-acetyltransferase [Lachnospiraceae bacterium]
MYIRKAESRELTKIMGVYKIARNFMVKHGNPGQWGPNDPSQALIDSFLHKEQVYVVCVGMDIKAVFVLSDGGEPAFDTLIDGNWVNNAPYRIIHWVASDGTEHGIMRFITDYAKDKCDNLRIATHEKNLPMRHKLATCGFKNCGTMRLESGAARMAFMWSRSMN